MKGLYDYFTKPVLLFPSELVEKKNVNTSPPKTPTPPPPRPDYSALSIHEQLALIEKDPFSIRFISNPSYEVQLAAVKLNPFAAGVNKNIDTSVFNKAVKMSNNVLALFDFEYAVFFNSYKLHKILVECFASIRNEFNLTQEEAYILFAENVTRFLPYFGKITANPSYGNVLGIN